MNPLTPPDPPPAAGLARPGQSQASLAQYLQGAVNLWAEHVTGADTPRRADLLRDKFNALLGQPADGERGSLGFFVYTQQPPQQVTALEVKAWQAYLEGQGLAPATVYAKISRVSSFYRWAIENGQASANPATPARPKAPKPYQNEAAQSLTDAEVARLLAAVRAAAAAGRLAARRDYAMLLFYLTTGMRRQEVVSLKVGDLRLEAARLLITNRVKGGDYSSRELTDPAVRAALLDYLAAREVRFEDLPPSTPLWVNCDPNPKYQGQAVGGHGFVKNLKRYAKAAGLGHLHLHQTRHTVARWSGEELGSLSETQEVLGHKNLATTKVYLQRVAVKKDKLSRRIIDRLGVGKNE
jgi:integrase/recombinase XerC